MKKVFIIFIAVFFNGCAYSTMIVCPDGRKVITAGFGLQKDISCIDPAENSEDNE